MRFARILKAGAVVASVTLASMTAGLSGAQAADQKVNAIIAGALNNVAMMVAAENGYWRELGLDVRMQTLDTGSQISKALLSGAADIGAGNATSSVPLSRASDNKLTMVGAYHNNPMVVNGVQRVGVIASAKSGAEAGNAESLIGKSIGVSLGSTADNYLRGYLEKAGVSVDDVNLVNLAVPEMAVALRQGTVDAVVTWEPYVSEIVRTEGDNAVVIVRGGPYGASVVGAVVTDEYFAAHKDLLEKYVLGAWKGDQFTRKDPEGAAAIAQRYIRGLNPVDAAAGIAFMKAEFDPRISPCTEAAVMQEQNALIAAGRMKAEKPFPYEDIVQVDFINKLIDAHPELFDDLEPVPASLEECGGR